MGSQATWRRLTQAFQKPRARDVLAHGMHRERVSEAGVSPSYGDFGRSISLHPQSKSGLRPAPPRCGRKITRVWGVACGSLLALSSSVLVTRVLGSRRAVEVPVTKFASFFTFLSFSRPIAPAPRGGRVAAEAFTGLLNSSRKVSIHRAVPPRRSTFYFYPSAPQHSYSAGRGT